MHASFRFAPALIALAIAIICVSVSLFATRIIQSESSALAIDSTYLDLGDVWADPTFTWTIPVRNLTTRSCAFSITASCVCSSVQPSHLKFAPGEIAKLTIQFDLTKFGATGQLPVNDFEVDFLAIPDRDAQNDVGPTKWTIRGRAHRAFSYDAVQLQLPSFRPHTGSVPVAISRINCLGDVVRFEAEADPPLAESTITPVPGVPRSYALGLSPLADLPPGPFEFLVRLTPLSEVGPFSFKGQVRGLIVSGYVLAPVQVAPTQLLLGNAQLGQTLEGVVMLRPDANVEWVSVSPRPSTSLIELQSLPATSRAPADRHYKVLVNVARPGTYQETVWFDISVTERGASTCFTLQVDVIWRGAHD